MTALLIYESIRSFFRRLTKQLRIHIIVLFVVKKR